MNGDGSVDIADPVVLLEHLFLGGPAPTCVAQEGATSAQVQQLQERVVALEALLAGVTRTTIPDGQGKELDTIRFSSVNLQVTNDTGRTGQSPNGLGNVIVGYNAPRVGGESVRTGSHTIVAGDQNNYSSWGSLVTGTRNDSTARFANVLGGRNKKADTEWERVGGVHDEAEDALSHVSIVQIASGASGVPGECYDDTVPHYKTIRFSGANVQIVSGRDSREVPLICDGPYDDLPIEPEPEPGAGRGLGNLFLGHVESVNFGYDPPYSAYPTGDARSGSHNLIVGGGHSWNRAGQIIGPSNIVTSGLAFEYEISLGIQPFDFVDAFKIDTHVPLDGTRLPIFLEQRIVELINGAQPESF